MALEPSLSYNWSADFVDEFANCGEGSELKFADHAFVFFIRGVQKRCKQPVVYFFTRGAMSSTSIVRNIKFMVKSLQDIGLSVVATVYDQYAVNMAAVRALIEETRPVYIRNAKGEKHWL